jgi:hypothetical protein
MMILKGVWSLTGRENVDWFNCRLLWTRWWTLGFHNSRGISWPVTVGFSRIVTLSGVTELLCLTNVRIRKSCLGFFSLLNSVLAWQFTDCVTVASSATKCRTGQWNTPRPHPSTSFQSCHLSRCDASIIVTLRWWSAVWRRTVWWISAFQKHLLLSYGSCLYTKWPGVAQSV